MKMILFLILINTEQSGVTDTDEADNEQSSSSAVDR